MLACAKNPFLVRKVFCVPKAHMSLGTVWSPVASVAMSPWCLLCRLLSEPDFYSS